MGTRNLTCVQKDNKIVVSQYCQWDGYPDGQGTTVVEFIKNKFDKDLFIQKLKNVKQITQKEYKALWIECGADPDNSWVSMDISKKFNEKYPHLYRDFGAEVLEFIQNSDSAIKLNNDKDFAKDSLFCEWVYVLNLDEDTLDVYSGFVTKEPEASIFYNPEKDEPQQKTADDKYYPVEKIISFKIRIIKIRKAETTIKEMEKAEKIREKALVAE